LKAVFSLLPFGKWQLLAAQTGRSLECPLSLGIEQTSHFRCWGMVGPIEHPTTARWQLRVAAHAVYEALGINHRVTVTVPPPVSGFG
jgi:hypothetical protein